MRYAETGPYRYIESKDLREHLQRTGFHFSMRDTAYLIWQCESISIEERRETLREVLENSGDPEMSAVLQRVMKSEEQILAWLYGPGEADYSCIYYSVCGGTTETNYRCRSFDECLKHFGEVENTKRVELSRRVTDEITVYAYLLPDGTILRVDAEGVAREEIKKLWRSLNSWAFEFSCPFISGEMLRLVNGVGIFANQSLRFIDGEYIPDAGMIAHCEYINGHGDKRIDGFLLLKLERSDVLDNYNLFCHTKPMETNVAAEQLMQKMPTKRGNGLAT